MADDGHRLRVRYRWFIRVIGCICAVLAGTTMRPAVAAAASAPSNQASLPEVPITVPVMPGQGVTFDQVDYTFAASPDVDSTTGQVEVDIAMLTASTAMSSGFLNVGTTSGWVVQNLPVSSGDPDPAIDTRFMLPASDGTTVTALGADVEFSSSPVSSFSTGTLQNYPVGDTSYDGSGKGTVPVSGTMSAPPPSAVVFPGGPAFTVCFQRGHPNIEAADNQCGPAAVANSFDYLRSQHGLPVPDPNVMGFCDNTSLVGKLDQLMSRCPNGSTRRSGVTVPDNRFMTGKLTYLSNNNLGNRMVLKHQARNDEGVGGGDFSAAGLTSKGQGGKPTAQFIIDEICAGEDVELGFIYMRGGHWVELTGAGSILGVPWITYKSDHDQANDANGTQFNDFSFLVDNDADGLLNLVNEGGNPNAQIVVSESVNPAANIPDAPAGTVFLLLPALLGGVLVYRRLPRRARASTATAAARR